MAASKTRKHRKYRGGAMKEIRTLEAPIARRRGNGRRRRRTKRGGNLLTSMLHLGSQLPGIQVLGHVTKGLGNLFSGSRLQGATSRGNGISYTWPNTSN